MAPDDPILLADVVDLILEGKLERWSRQQTWHKPQCSTATLARARLPFALSLGDGEAGTAVAISDTTK